MEKTDHERIAERLWKLLDKSHYDDEDANLSDLLCDAMHWAHAINHDFDEALQSARNNFAAEKPGEEPDEKAFVRECRLNYDEAKKSED